MTDVGDEFDVIVIGGGPAGENAAWYARDHGLEVALVERELVGGECSYWACMPSKALLRPGEALAAARRVPGAAPAVTAGVDVAATLTSRDAFSSHWDDKHQVRWVEGTGTTLVRGQGRLAGDRTVEVTAEDGTHRTLHARRGVVVATGTSAAIPPVEGLRDIAVWDSRDITTAQQVPARLLVLGGGVVGVEMAQAFGRLGAAVTVVEMSDRLLATEEPFVGAEIRGAFEDEGITVHLDAEAVRAERDGGGPVTLTLADGTALVADEIVVATGRRPNTGDLGLETVGLEPGRSIGTDDQLRATGVEGGWLYAIGDVNGRALLTHHGKYQARLVGDHLAGVSVEARADHQAVVRVVFTDPQVAAVGLTLASAEEQGLDVEVLTTGVGDVAGAALLGKGVSGTAQLVVDRKGRTIVGATFTGPGVGEMIHAATIAIVSGITLDDLWHAVPAFPTVSEVWLRLLETDRGIS
jgi:pyruvate/2-oxoglutarate dehydrogenase complex dihydrolipoamide dehydrogenase (E3) component